MSKLSFNTKFLLRQEASKAKLKQLKEKTELAKLQDCCFKPQINITKTAKRNIPAQTVSIKYIFLIK